MSNELEASMRDHNSNGACLTSEDYSPFIPNCHGTHQTVPSMNGIAPSEWTIFTGY